MTYINTSALARSLHDVWRGHNNRKAVVVCLNSAFRASGMGNIGDFRIRVVFFHILNIHDDVLIRK